MRALAPTDGGPPFFARFGEFSRGIYPVRLRWGCLTFPVESEKVCCKRTRLVMKPASKIFSVCLVVLALSTAAWSGIKTPSGGGGGEAEGLLNDLCKYDIATSVWTYHSDS